MLFKKILLILLLFIGLLGISFADFNESDCKELYTLKNKLDTVEKNLNDIEVINNSKKYDYYLGLKKGLEKKYNYLVNKCKKVESNINYEKFDEFDCKELYTLKNELDTVEKNLNNVEVINNSKKYDYYLGLKKDLEKKYFYLTKKCKNTKYNIISIVKEVSNKREVNNLLNTLRNSKTDDKKFEITKLLLLKQIDQINSRLLIYKVKLNNSEIKNKDLLLKNLILFEDEIEDIKNRILTADSLSELRELGLELREINRKFINHMRIVHLIAVSNDYKNVFDKLNGILNKVEDRGVEVYDLKSEVNQLSEDYENLIIDITMSDFENLGERISTYQTKKNEIKRKLNKIALELRKRIIESFNLNYENEAEVNQSNSEAGNNNLNETTNINSSIDYENNYNNTTYLNNSEFENNLNVTENNTEVSS